MIKARWIHGVGAWLGLCLITSTCTAAPDLTGYWRVENYVEQLRTTQGGVPPLKPEALALYEQRSAMKKAGKLDFDPAARCISPGVPRVMFLPYAIEFLQEKQALTMLFAWNHLFRTIPFQAAEPKADYPLYMGVSTGGWQGATLVVNTIGLKEEALLDAHGLPGSKDLRITERYSLDRNGQRLTSVITINDPVNYTAPWQTRVTYRRLPAGFRFAEDVCLDRTDAGRPAIEVPADMKVAR